MKNSGTKRCTGKCLLSRPAWDDWCLKYGWDAEEEMKKAFAITEEEALRVSSLIHRSSLAERVVGMPKDGLREIFIPASSATGCDCGVEEGDGDGGK
jgi:hypothetical protein